MTFRTLSNEELASSALFFARDSCDAHTECYRIFCEDKVIAYANEIINRKSQSELFPGTYDALRELHV